jgi:hypothetical protein
MISEKHNQPSWLCSAGRGTVSLSGIEMDDRSFGPGPESQTRVWMPNRSPCTGSGEPSELSFNLRLCSGFTIPLHLFLTQIPYLYFTSSDKVNRSDIIDSDILWYHDNIADTLWYHMYNIIYSRCYCTWFYTHEIHDIKITWNNRFMLSTPPLHMKIINM